jgi:AhpD family alkylhydroperoxidase
LILFHAAQDAQVTDHSNGELFVMNEAADKFRGLTRSVSAGLSSLRTSTPEVMKSFSELGRAATADGALDAKTKELIALALSVAVRCDPCIGFHVQTLVKLGATRQELDETLGVTTYMGGGPSLMYAANAIAAFDEFSRAASARTA